MSKEITIDLDQLEFLLRQQKELVVENLLSMTYYYNTETTDGHSKSMQNIDKEKFREVAFKAEYPSDLEILKRYLK